MRFIFISNTSFFFREFSISYLARDEEGKDTYLSLLSDWDLDAAFLGSSDPCLQLKVDLKPFEEGMFVYQCNQCR